MRSLITFLCAVLNFRQHTSSRLMMVLPLPVLAFQHVQRKRPTVGRCCPPRSAQHLVFAAKGDQSSINPSSKNTVKKQRSTKKAANKNRRAPLKGNGGALKTASSANASEKKRKARIKTPSRKSKKKSATTIASKKNEHTSSTYYIQFSRVFQRHVVYKTKTDTTTLTANDQVIQSFLFLDDATTAYPKARIVAPRDVPFPPPLCTIDWTLMSSSSSASAGVAAGYNKVEEECETTIAGMGLFGLCELEYDVANNHVHNTNGKYPVDTSTITTIDGGNGDNQQQQHH